jgi:hypothetical protein
MTTDVLAGWTKSEFTAAGFTRDVYRRGTGPGVVIVHEIPGITPKVTQFANEVVERGFTVCIAREFSSWAMNQTSPIIGWLRALARNLHQEVGGPGVGAVGMCFSGGFALAMMVDDIMVAPVLSQPSMPFAVGKKDRGADLNLSPDDALVVARRAAEGCQVLGLRYTGDKLVGTRFETLRHLLGDAFIAVELPSTAKNDHSVLTEQRDDASVEQVLAFFEAKLTPRT